MDLEPRGGASAASRTSGNSRASLSDAGPEGGSREVPADGGPGGEGGGGKYVELCGLTARGPE